MKHFWVVLKQTTFIDSFSPEGTLTDSCGEVAVLHVIDRNVVVVDAGGARVDAQEVAVATIRRVLVIVVVDTLGARALAAISAIKALSKNRATAGKTKSQ